MVISLFFEICSPKIMSQSFISLVLLNFNFISAAQFLPLGGAAWLEGARFGLLPFSLPFSDGSLDGRYFPSLRAIKL